MSMRHIPRPDFNLENFRSPRRTPQRCLVCGEATREGKVYCSEHVEESNYVTDVQHKYAAIQGELKRVKKLGIKAIAPDSYFVSEILRALRVEDGLQFGELSHESDVPYDVLPHYLDMLQIWGLIELEPDLDSKRKTPLVFLLEEPRPLYTAPQLAKKLGINVFKIKRAIKYGVPHVNVGGRNYFEPEKYMAWKAKRRLYITSRLVEAGNKNRKKKLQQFEAKVKSKDKELLNVTELAEKMGVSGSTVKYWITKGVPNYPQQTTLIGGRGEKNLRFFKLDEVKEWYETFRANYDEVRKKSNMRHDWATIIEDAKQFGLTVAAKKHKVNRETLRDKIRNLHPVELKPSDANSTRNVAVSDAAKILGIRPVTISKWINEMGAPHEKVTMYHTARMRVLVDPEELKTWYADRKKTPKRKTKPSSKY